MWSRNKKISQLLKDLALQNPSKQFLNIDSDDLNFIQQSLVTREDNIFHLRIFLMQLIDNIQSSNGSYQCQTQSQSNEIRQIIAIIQNLERTRSHHEDFIIQKYDPLKFSKPLESKFQNVQNNNNSNHDNQSSSLNSNCSNLPVTQQNNSNSSSASVVKIQQNNGNNNSNNQQQNSNLQIIKTVGYKLLSRTRKIQNSYIQKIQVFFPKLYELIFADQLNINTTIKDLSQQIISSPALSFSKVFQAIARAGKMRLQKEINRLQNFQSIQSILVQDKHRSKQNERFYSDKFLSGIDSFNYITGIQKKFFLHTSHYPKSFKQSNIQTQNTPNSVLNLENSSEGVSSNIVNQPNYDTLQDLMFIDKKKDNNEAIIGDKISGSQSYESIFEVILSNYEKQMKDSMQSNKYISFKIKVYYQQTVNNRMMKSPKKQGASNPVMEISLKPVNTKILQGNNAYENIMVSSVKRSSHLAQNFLSNMNFKLQIPNQLTNSMPKQQQQLQQQQQRHQQQQQQQQQLQQQQQQLQQQLKGENQNVNPRNKNDQDQIKYSFLRPINHSDIEEQDKLFSPLILESNFHTNLNIDSNKSNGEKNNMNEAQQNNQKSYVFCPSNKYIKIHSSSQNLNEVNSCSELSNKEIKQPKLQSEVFNDNLMKVNKIKTDFSTTPPILSSVIQSNLKELVSFDLNTFSSQLSQSVPQSPFPFYSQSSQTSIYEPEVNTNQNALIFSSSTSKCSVTHKDSFPSQQQAQQYNVYKTVHCHLNSTKSNLDSNQQQEYNDCNQKNSSNLNEKNLQIKGFSKHIQQNTKDAPLRSSLNIEVGGGEQFSLAKSGYFQLNKFPQYQRDSKGQIKSQKLQQHETKSPLDDIFPTYIPIKSTGQSLGSKQLNSPHPSFSGFKSLQSTSIHAEYQIQESYVTPHVVGEDKLKLSINTPTLTSIKKVNKQNDQSQIFLNSIGKIQRMQINLDHHNNNEIHHKKKQSLSEFISPTSSNYSVNCIHHENKMSKNQHKQAQSVQISQEYETKQSQQQSQQQLEAATKKSNKDFSSIISKNITMRRSNQNSQARLDSGKVKESLSQADQQKGIQNNYFLNKTNAQQHLLMNVKADEGAEGNNNITPFSFFYPSKKQRKSSKLIQKSTIDKQLPSSSSNNNNRSKEPENNTKEDVNRVNSKEENKKINSYSSSLFLGVEPQYLNKDKPNGFFFQEGVQDSTSIRYKSSLKDYKPKSSLLSSMSDLQAVKTLFTSPSRKLILPHNHNNNNINVLQSPSSVSSAGQNIQQQENGNGQAFNLKYSRYANNQSITRNLINRHSFQFTNNNTNSSREVIGHTNTEM